MTRTFRRIGFASTLALLAAACGHKEDVRLTGDHPVAEGVVANTDIRIVAVDRSFELDGGRPFKTPFQSDLWGPDFDGFTINPSVYYPMALSHGARRVVIYVGGDTTPLYGVLAFNPASQFSYGPDTQQYRLSISDAELARADEGHIAVAYEKVNWTREGKSDWGLGAVLWFSSVPLP